MNITIIEKDQKSIDMLPNLQKIKEIQPFLQNPKIFDKISHLFFTDIEINKIIEKLHKYIIDFYKDYETLANVGYWGSFYSYVSKNEKLYLLRSNEYNNKIDPPEINLSEKILNGMIYSPFSVYFFHQVFYDSLNPYFTGKLVLKRTDQFINDIVSNIKKYTRDNIKICPPFLINLFTTNFKYGKKTRTPDFFFKDIILEEFFKKPQLFHLLEFNQEMKLNDDDCQYLKNCLRDNLKFTDNFKGFIPQQEGLMRFLEDIQFSKESDSSASLLAFRDLIKCGKELPDQIPKEMANQSLLEQIKRLLVDEDIKKNQEQVKCFNQLRRFLEKERLKKEKDITEHLMNGIEKMMYEIQVNEFLSMLNKTFCHLKILVFSKKNKDIFKASQLHLKYINDPCFFKKEIERIYNENQNRKISPQDNYLDDSMVEVSIVDPIFLNRIILQKVTFHNFIKRRYQLTLANQAFENKNCLIESDLSDGYMPLLELKENNPSDFDEILTVFNSAFILNTSPYETARAIAKAFLFAVGHVNMYIRINELTCDELSIENELDLSFILTLFKLAKPPNVVSTYIYLFEFLFSPAYKSSIFKQNKNLNVKLANDILSTYIFNFTTTYNDVFFYAEFCKINHIHVNLVLKKDDNFLDKLAEFVSPEQKDIEAYKQTFKLLRNFFLRTHNDQVPQFTFRIYQKVDNDAKIWICHVTSLSVDKYDNLPLDQDNRNRLFEFLETKKTKV